MAPFLFFLFGAGFCFHFLCSQPPRSWGSVQWSRPFVWDERRDDRYQSPQMPPRVPAAPTCSAGPGPALNVGGQSSLCPLGEKAKRNPRPASQGSAARSEGVCGSAPHLTQRPSLFPGERRFWSTQSPGSEATLGCACVGVKAAIASGSLATRAGADLSSAPERQDHHPLGGHPQKELLSCATSPAGNEPVPRMLDDCTAPLHD